MSSPAADPETLSRFMELTDCDIYQASFLLEAAHGNFDVALNMYYDQAGAVPTATQTQRLPMPRVTPPRPAAPVAAPRPHNAPPPSLISRIVVAAIQFPFRLLHFGFRLVPAAVNWTITAVSVIGNRVLPASIVRWLRDLTGQLRGPVHEPDAPGQSRSFIQWFKHRYGDIHPRFVELGWQDATSFAQREFKFLFVYLHAPDHQDTDAFCRTTLCSPELVELVNHNFVAWGGDIRQQDAFMLASRLKVTRFPYVGLLAFGGSRTRLVAAAHGRNNSNEVMRVLVRALEEQGPMLVAERAEQEQREMSRRLLEEQNREYEEALMADRERERMREEERRRQREEEERRQQEEEEERQRKADEERAAVAAAIAAEERRLMKAASLGPEAAAGEAAAALRIRLPDGSTCQRRFFANQTVQDVLDFVESREGFSYASYSLVSNFPRKLFNASTAKLTLEEAGLTPQGALFVQPD